MKLLNFIAPHHKDLEAYGVLATCCVSGFCYEDVVDLLGNLGYYIPEDQYDAFAVVIDIQIDLDIGGRQDEYRTG